MRFARCYTGYTVGPLTMSLLNNSIFDYTKEATLQYKVLIHNVSVLLLKYLSLRALGQERTGFTFRSLFNDHSKQYDNLTREDKNNITWSLLYAISVMLMHSVLAGHSLQILYAPTFRHVHPCTAPYIRHHQHLKLFPFKERGNTLLVAAPK